MRISHRDATGERSVSLAEPSEYLRGMTTHTLRSCVEAVDFSCSWANAQLATHLT